MRDGNPLVFELVAHVHRVAKFLPQVFKVELRKLVNRRVLDYPDVRVALKDGEVNLAQDGGKRVVQLPKEDIFLDGGVCFALEHQVSQGHFAECGGGFRQGQAGVLGIERVLFSHHGMHGVPEFVRHGGDVF